MRVNFKLDDEKVKENFFHWPRPISQSCDFASFTDGDPTNSLVAGDVEFWLMIQHESTDTPLYNIHHGNSHKTNIWVENMTDASRFNLMLEDRIGFGKTKADVIQALSDIFQKPAAQIERLFHKSPGIIKRDLTLSQARRMMAYLDRAGAVCRIVPVAQEETLPASPDRAEREKTCPKCGYDLSSADACMVEDECPACQIIISKFKSSADKMVDDTMAHEGQRARLDSVDGGSATSAAPLAACEYAVEYGKQGLLLQILGFSFGLPARVELRSMPADLPSASLYQRFWGAVASFSYLVYLTVVMQIPVGVLAAPFLLIAGETGGADLIQTLRGISVLAAMGVGFVLMPMAWCGHSFGQRLTGIVLVSNDDRETVGLTTDRTIFRILADATRLIYGIGLLVALLRQDRRSIGDLASGVRQASAGSLPEKPWNKALLPFAVAVGIHMMVAIPGAWITGMVGDARKSYPNHRTSMQTVKAKALQQQHAVQARVAELDGGVIDQSISVATPLDARKYNWMKRLPRAFRNHVYRHGPVALDRDSLDNILSTYLPVYRSEILREYDSGDLQVHGDTLSYEIGLRQEDDWFVLDKDGYPHRQDKY